MEIGLTLLSIVVGYVFGSLSFTRLIARIIIPGEDISSTRFEMPGKDIGMEMTSVSPTALSMRKGPGAGCSASILDMLKAAIPAFILMRLYPDQPYFLISSAMAIIGHNWPIQHSLKGGRGFSPMIGSLFVIDFWSIPFAMISGNLIGLGVVKDVFLAYIMFAVMLIPWMTFRFWNSVDIHVLWYVAYAAWATGTFLFASRSEITQYLEIKRSGVLDDREEFLDAIEQTDMGRPIKYMRKYGFFGGPKEENATEA
ncbi:MAG: glycerol-3-phosphate acyltransferase [Chloroflexota bacterium]